MTENNTSTRATGALATRLTTALEQTQQALGPHAALVAGGTLAELDAMLAEFARRRVRIALYGEVKAGKSTLLNAIAGSTLSPVAFEPLTSVPVRITYGEETVWRVGDNTVASADDVARLMRAEEPVQEVVVETALDLLQLGGQVDLLDTPGVGSDERFDSVTGDALRSLDAVVLVVRYPGLFTQATRSLMNGLHSEMGKLFVVWNLDQNCADLGATERTHHTETLRANVAGAHDLFLVDARNGFEATKRRDAAAIAASGLGNFTAALTRFVASGARDLTAVREAAKRALRYLRGAQRTLSERLEGLRQALHEARERLRGAQAAADASSDAERSRREEFDSKVGRLAEEYRALATKLAGDLRQRLRSARRRWIRDANPTALAESVAVAVNDYADAVESSARQTTERLLAEAETYGTVVHIAARPRTLPELGDLAPEERLQQATSGNLQLVRRALWRRWYLPGVDTLIGRRVDEDLDSQNAWLDGAANTARTAAAQTLQTRLAETAERFRAEQEQIKSETSFDANEAEFAQLSVNLPLVVRELETIAEISTEARSFS